MQVAIDSVGNLRGVYEGEAAETTRLILASHLDTVPNAGKYDGILGVLLAISLIESLQGKRLPFAIEVIGFSDEEGVRYGLPFIGSRGLTGGLAPAHLQLQDVDGVSLAAALDTLAHSHASAIPAKLHPSSRAYLEFHIEQGPCAGREAPGARVVEAIAGQSRATLTFRGRAGHAGTTPMALRRDAMTAAAEWILFVESTALATPGMVASTGRVICEPGAGNIIPGFVRCSLDLRSADDDLRHTSVQLILDAARTIAERRKVEVSHTMDAEQATVFLQPSLTLLTQQAVEQTQGEASRMVSGAGHDAMILAPHLPTAMIFSAAPVASAIIRRRQFWPVMSLPHCERAYNF